MTILEPQQRIHDYRYQAVVGIMLRVDLRVSDCKSGCFGNCTNSSLKLELLKRARSTSDPSSLISIVLKDAGFDRRKACSECNKEANRIKERAAEGWHKALSTQPSIFDTPKLVNSPVRRGRVFAA